jgi:hypothetical protein
VVDSTYDREYATDTRPGPKGRALVRTRPEKGCFPGLLKTSSTRLRGSGSQRPFAGRQIFLHLIST